MESSRTIWTIGHSNHTLERLIELLRSETIDFVVDVRSYPYSRIAPQFNREDLQTALNRIGTHYLFFGNELGGRPGRDDHYDDAGRARYDLMAGEPAFQASLRRLLEGCRHHRIVLLCSEGQPQECHRRLLVGKVLADHGVRLRHVLPDGEVMEEDEVRLGRADGQATLFHEEAPWTSTRSVSHRRRLSTSSAA